MRLAYIISAYKYPQQLIRLIRRLHNSQASIFIHIDRKTDEREYEDVVQAIGHMPDVYFLKRYHCYWGEFGHVQATREGIKQLIERAIPFDYAILLTGQDYPIKTNRQIVDFLRQSSGTSFMDYFSLPHEEWQYGGLNRIERWHIRFFQRRYIFPMDRSTWIKRRFPRGFQPFGGSSYWCLANECIEYIYRRVKDRPDLLRFFRSVDVPDEIFFQTILMNSPLREHIANDDLHYIDWKDLNGGSPGILCKADFEAIMQSPKLFARKFDMTVDPDVLDMIDRVIEEEGVRSG